MTSTLSSTDADFENFGHKVYLTVSRNNNNENVFLSSASIALAMAMCATGARNETLNQMLRILDASSIDQLTKTAEQIMRIFSTVNNDTQVKLKLVNRLYGQKAYELRQDYLSLVQSSFKADIKLEDFVNDSADVVKTINGWVEEQTNSLIKNLLSSNDVTRDTRLIIVNCIYFKGTWVEQFKEHLTDQNADFHETNDKISKIKLMHQKKTFRYAENNDLNVQIAHLPYESDKHGVRFVFTVILPKRDISLDIVEQKLASKPDLMRRVLSDEDTTKKELLLYLPRFKMEAKFELNDVLIQLGMINAFDGSKADFTGMVSEQDDRTGLYISKVIHKAFVDVNELGSEAAAATAVIMTRCCAFIVEEEQPIEFKADRPFLFFIRETRQNIVLFSGKFASPPTTS
ncbi:unnamed protein product [Rotaria sordida]|uniref:Serpin domain-containing protein n=1 Tax=Rotaria sordida TaxID=392033 RepID=A0A814VRM5_9BILA|nr:unnamed protein product [Rotaria sordida]CAF1458087.1 unnamed protein product [Rotaria sordida]